MTNEAKILITIALVSIFIVVGGALFLGNSSSTPKEPQVVSKKLLVTKDSEKKGSNSAKLTLVEFSDFQCPACQAWFPVVAQVLQKHPENVLFVFRHFPLDGHKNAKQAAYAAEAAGKQGKFWEMHDLLYENQSEWSESKNPQELFAQYATTIGLDNQKWLSDIKSKAVTEEVNQDIQDGYAVGVNSTPTFYLNDKKLELSGFDDLSKQIDEAVAKQ